jgi:hypothetical protein
MKWPDGVCIEAESEIEQGHGKQADQSHHSLAHQQVDIERCDAEQRQHNTERERIH